MSTVSSGESASDEVTVSVVIPCFQAEGTVRRAIASVLAQTVRPVEIIVVDDGSSDRTPEILAELSRLHESRRLRVLRLGMNRGPSAARNAGWNAATGQYVAFLDADDTWHPKKVEIQFGFLRLHPDVALVGHGHVHDPRDLAEDPSAGWQEISFRQLLLRNRFVTPSVMIQRDIALRFRDEQRHMEDHLLWLQIARAGHRILRLDAALAVVHKAAYGVSGQSADLLSMERAELGNYARLRRDGCIGGVTHAAIVAWSMLKFVRRLFIVGARKLRG